MDNCVGKYVNANHRIMGVYMEVQSAMVNKRIKEYNETQAAAQVAAQAQTVEQ